jgi:hypothetical protein
MIYQKFEANDSGAHYALIFIQEELEKRNILPSDDALAKEARAGYARGIEARKQVLGL